MRVSSWGFYFTMPLCSILDHICEWMFARVHKHTRWHVIKHQRATLGKWGPGSKVTGRVAASSGRHTRPRKLGHAQDDERAIRLLIRCLLTRLGEVGGWSHTLVGARLRPITTPTILFAQRERACQRLLKQQASRLRCAHCHNHAHCCIEYHLRTASYMFDTH